MPDVLVGTAGRLGSTHPLLSMPSQISPYTLLRVTEFFTGQFRVSRVSFPRDRKRSTTLSRTKPAMDPLPFPPYSMGQHSYKLLKQRFIHLPFDGKSIYIYKIPKLTISNPPHFLIRSWNAGAWKTQFNRFLPWQGLTNNGPHTKFNPPPAFANKALLEHNHTHSFLYRLCLFSHYDSRLE